MPPILKAGCAFSKATSGPSLPLRRRRRRLLISFIPSNAKPAPRTKGYARQMLAYPVFLEVPEIVDQRRIAISIWLWRMWRSIF